MRTIIATRWLPGKKRIRRPTASSSHEIIQQLWTRAAWKKRGRTSRKHQLFSRPDCEVLSIVAININLFDKPLITHWHWNCPLKSYWLTHALRMNMITLFFSASQTRPARSTFTTWLSERWERFGMLACLRWEGAASGDMA